MKAISLNQALAASVQGAKAAGGVMRRNLFLAKKANAITSHDIKLELDVRCQKLIEKKLKVAFPAISFLGEEGNSGADDSEYRWVVDPIDGTVNYAYGIPHACVSIALQKKVEGQGPRVEGRNSRTSRVTRPASHVTLLGVVYDPFQDELWTAIRGEPARLNGAVIRVSKRRKLAETVVSIGFAKSRGSLQRALPYFTWLARRVRKIRMLGAAALGLTYVATGRLDAYIERGVNLWDVAAGGLIIECAGGKFWHEPTSDGKLRIIGSNAAIHRQLPVPR